MKKVIAGCIDLMLEFDSASELDRYIADIEVKKQEYSIVDRKELPGDRIMIRIHRQYNKSPFPTNVRIPHPFFDLLFCTADCKSCNYDADYCRRYWIPYLGGYKES